MSELIMSERWIAVHSHKHGVDSYPFDWYASVAPALFYDEPEVEIGRALGINYEPNIMEDLILVPPDETNDIPSLPITLYEEGRESIEVTYTSQWDSGTSVDSKGKYDPRSMIVYDVETQEEVDVGNAQLVSEYITLPDNTELDEGDGVRFAYKEDTIDAN